MKIAFISGSGRKDSQSGKVALFAEAMFKNNFPQAETFVLDLGKTPMPLFDEGLWDKNEFWQKVWGPTSDQLKSCDAFVIVVPEWNGIAPAAAKNFFHICSEKELAHKPAMLIGVSSNGTGGAYPVAEMRMSTSKNSYIVYIPDHVLIRNVQKNLNETEAVSDEDRYFRDRLQYSLKVLAEYAKVMQPIRSSAVVDFKKYPNGM